MTPLTREEIERITAGTTDGPWRLSHDGTAIIYRQDEPVVAVAVAHRPLKEQRANARLIAAAPDLAHTALHWMAEAERLREERDDLLNEMKALTLPERRPSHGDPVVLRDYAREVCERFQAILARATEARND